MKNPFRKFDNLFINLINRKLKNKYFDIFFFYFTNICGVRSLSIFCVLLFIFGSGKSRYLAVEIIITLVCSSLVVQLLKRTFNRNRPYWIMSNLNTFGLDLSDYSFPSGHSTAGFSLATVLALNFPQLSVIIFFVALLVAISRIYLAVHYPTDVVAGITIGIVTGYIVHNYTFSYIVDVLNTKFNL